MKYLTFAETIRENGERHMANAAKWEAAGKPDYAAGSRRKAGRNFLRAKAMELPALPAQLQELKHFLEHLILNGNERR